MVKKIALIVPNNLWVSPYLFIYTRIFDTLGVDYDVISWDREGREELGIQFHHREKSRKQLAIIWSYIKYTRFLIKTIKNKKYDKLVIFTPQVGLFIASFLEKYYKGRYIFDYRDLSIEQRPLFSNRFKKVLVNSYANVISSPGFKKYLPSGYDYIISHNFNVELVNNALSQNVKPYTGYDNSLLTIGALRTDMNPEVIDALGNISGFSLSFVGKGISAEYLENFTKEKGYENVIFSGYYKKEEEPEIYEKHTFVNIIYPLIPSHISAMSNRFYNSLIYKRPMIVTNGTVQGDYANEYGVGLVIDNCIGLKDKIIKYRENLVYSEYVHNCNRLLNVFLEDNKKFEGTIKEFVKL